MKRILYLRVEIESPEGRDPMQSLSDAAFWSECRLTHDDIYSRATAYNTAKDIVQDEADGVFGKPPNAPN